jgi:hypothetical protein
MSLILAPFPVSASYGPVEERGAPQNNAWAEYDQQSEEPDLRDEGPVAAERLVVKNPQGVELGEVINFVVDTDIGKVAYVLLDTGNTNAMEDLRLVPVNALAVENNQLILNMNQQQLANAPTPAPGLDSEEFHRLVSEYYGVAPYWEE